MSKDDQEWVREALGGKPDAFCHLVRKYQDRLYRTLIQITGKPEDARDLAQEAFVQAFVKLETFQGKSTFYTWLHRIAYNQAMSHLRKKRPLLEADQPKDKTTPDPSDPQDGPEGQLDQAQRVELVQQALQQLSDEHRHILVLKEMDGLRYEEIAEVLDLAVGTVRSRLFRARQRLKEILAADFSPEDLPS
ncbi:RNA polymerase ECF-type sigma factor [Planctomycetales bacterium 10988]|nr:RNA polymerase ECF-type sigma factor [Planctomycetales bacterium 10988]